MLSSCMLPISPNFSLIPIIKVAEFRKVFDSFDRNGDESIGVEELGSVLRALGYSPSESDIEKVG